MSNQKARAATQPAEGVTDTATTVAGTTTTVAGNTTTVAGNATTLVRADEDSSGTEGGELHPQLRAHLKEVRLRTNAVAPDLSMLLRVISAHYDSIDEERRGIVQSMRLMADEARALAHEAREQSSEHLQVILDHIKDVVITLDEDGVIQTFNPTGERVFGHMEAEVVGQRVDLLIPRIASHEPVAQALQRLAASSGDTQIDLASRESWGQRKDGEFFPAEIAVSKARLARREVFVLCLRDVTDRRQSEQAVRESEARYRLLVDHAPEAIVVLDFDAGLFADVNVHAERLFALDRARLLQVGPVDLSPPHQPDGAASAERAREYIQRALDGEPQVFEWLHRDAFGKEIICEVRLVRLPSETRRLVRGSIADISDRKRAERVAAAEHEVFQQLSGNAPLPQVLASITRLIESVGVGTVCSVSLLAEDGQSFSHIVAPRLSEKLRAVLERSPIDIRNGSCAAAVHLGRQVLVADVARDEYWLQRRAAALEANLHAAWATPLKAANGRLLGSLGIYRTEAGLPTAREAETMAHAAQLAAIAIQRRLAEDALRGSEAKFRGLFESIAEGVYQSGRDGRLHSVNPAFVQIMGYASAEELYALPSVAMLYWNPADRAEFMRQVESEDEIRNFEFRMRRRDGQQVVILENARVVRDAANRVVGYEGTIADITERKRAEQAVFAEKERAQVTLQSIGDAVISTDAEGRIEYINPVAETLTAWSLDEARGRPIAEVLNLVNEITREPIGNPLMSALGLSETRAAAEHSVLITRSGQEVAIQESAAPICDRQGKVIGAVIVFHDVTKERRLKRALSYQASHDALTGLINRREFDNRLHAAVQSAQQGEGSYALLYIDLDQFKVVNDTCGHQAGDRLLRDVTGLLQTRVRASDTIARLGGDEFGVLLEGCTLEQASRIADGVRQSIRDYRFVWGSSTMSVGASVGVVQIKPDTPNVASVMSAADIACYAAKDEGRNRIHVYEQDGVSHRHREMHWVARVTRAVEENRLELYFQPIVPVARTAGAAAAPVAPRVQTFHELTVRLRDDDGQLVPPSEFIPAAERYNVMSIIDRWVVSRAVELLKQRHQSGAALPLVAVNLSGTSLNEQAFADFVLQNAGEPAIAAALCFEITETAAVTSLSHATYFMRELKARGCKFSLDDFGSGLSSFMYLKTLPVDFLKIDGQFIGNIARDQVDRSMVEAISKVGRALGIATVAECVESEAVLAELGRIGVDFAQGYFVAAPLPIAQLGA
ncbi:MAG TPA: PAS domain S-box protein [Steroidobacteraceae bacterium]|nr:PAS domain S-box protein [Steroidobacteraceae bacterium]